MLLKIIRWVLGYVVFSTEGPFTERFMNLSARSKISLWDVRKSNKVFFASVAVGDYKNIRGICRRSGVKLRVREKHGLPFITNKYKGRAGLVVGFVSFFVVIYFLSLYVWNVNVEGNIDIKTEDVKSVMFELGLFEGALKNEIDVPMLEQNAMIKMPNTAWLSVNIQGSCATVSLKERIVPPNIVPQDKPCNIKAAFDGQIERMEVYEGEPVVKNGDAVAKGQLLVSGIVEDDCGGSSLKHADARIYAYVKREIHEQVDWVQEESIPTGKIVIRKRAKLFGVDLPLTLVPIPKGEFKKEVYLNQARVGDSELPFSTYTEKWTEQNKTNIRLSKQQAAKKADALLLKREETELKDAEIIEKNKVERSDNEKYYIDVEYYCKIDISIKEEIKLN